jgi:hypothetical protein
MSEKAIPFALGLTFGIDPDYAFLFGLIIYIIISILIGKKRYLNYETKL